MPFDLKKIDAEIERLETIRKVMSDPRSAQLIEQMLSGRNGVTNGTAVHAMKFDKRKPSQAAYVRRAITTTDGPFTVTTLSDALRESGVKIDNVEVSRSLVRFARLEEIKVVEKGVGKQPNVYEKTEKFRAME